MRLRPIREREGGVILLLTLFVILITYALVAQLTIGTSVAYQVSKNSADRVRMRRAAMDVAGEEVLRLLGDDLPAGEGEGEGAADAAGGLDGGLGGQTPGAPTAPGASGAPGEGGEGEEEEDDGSNSDSRNDDWWRPTRFPVRDMEVHGFVQDENGKFNILTLFSPNEAERDEARDRFVRILDALREDFDDDLSLTDAERILEEYIAWVEGDARDRDYPPLQSHSAKLIAERAAEEQANAALSADAPAEEGEREIYQDLYLPVSLEELMLLEHVDEDLYYDEVRERDRIAPGLQTVFTVYTQVAFDPPSDEELSDATGETGLGGAAGGGLDGGAPGDGGAEGPDSNQDETEEGDSLTEPVGGLDDVLEAPAAIGPAINVNTAPAAVLQGLLPRETLPTYFVDAILRYRNEVDEEALQELEGEQVDHDEMELRRAVYREERKVPLRYFRNLDDLTELEGWEERLDEEQRQAFRDLVGVQSDVFSIHLWARIPAEEWEQEEHYEEPPGPVLRLKAVVWRREGEDGAKFIFLEPWHEVARTRWHIPDFQNEIGPYQPPRD